MIDKKEKWAVFWCELLNPIIYADIEPELVHRTLRQIAKKEVRFPDGEIRKPSLSTLKRKLKRYRAGGFNALFRKTRSDIGKPRAVEDEIIAKVIELKKEQPFRSPMVINQFLKNRYGITLPPTTIYWHLKQAGATRKKLGITKKKVRKRWTKDHTHDLWIGDFEEGPYVMEGEEILPTYLSAFIDCHSRYIVEARYYLRQNLDVLIDSFVRGLSVHGAPSAIYLDNAKVYHSHGLKVACYKTGIRLLYRPPGEPQPGGVIERFFQTAQNQFEAEVRAGDILSLDQLNKAFSAWLAVSYHKQIHSEIKQPPGKQYRQGLRVIRRVDIKEVMTSFMQKIQRTVNPTFSDVQLNKKYYQVDPGLRGDKVLVAFDPFTKVDTVVIYSLNGAYLGEGNQHFREAGRSPAPPRQAKPKHSYLDLIIRDHKHQLDKQTKGVDYRNISKGRSFPFHEFVKLIAHLLGKKGAITAFSAYDLEKLKKIYNHSTKIDPKMTRQAVANADIKSIPYIIHELKQLIKQEE